MASELRDPYGAIITEELDGLQKEKPKVSYCKAFFTSGPLHSDWVPAYLVARDAMGVTIRSESGDRRTFYPWHIVESIETERRES